MINGPSSYVDSVDLKVLRGAGDSVAVAALRILDPQRPPTEIQISSLVDMLNVAFENIALIKDPDDRIPGVSLFMLRNVGTNRFSPTLNTKIEKMIEMLTALRVRVTTSAGRK